MNWASLAAQTVKNLPARLKIWVWSLVGKIPGERNGNPLQYSCLENPMDRGAWWTTVHGLEKSQTRLTTHACIKWITLYWTASLLAGLGKSTTAVWGVPHYTQVYGTRRHSCWAKVSSQFPSSCHFGMRWKMKSLKKFSVVVHCPSAWADVILDGGVVVRDRSSKTTNPRAVGWGWPWTQPVRWDL